MLGLVGEGEMPSEFERVNWGAYIVPPFWAAFFGLRRVVIAYAVYILGYIVVANVVLVFAPVATFERLDGLNNAVGLPLLALAAVVLGLKANRYLWRVQQLRHSGPAGSQSIPVWRLRKSNRFWFRFATVLFVVNVLGLLSSLVMEPTSLLSDWPSVLSGLVLPAMYVYDLWLAHRVRAAS
jgi:hypothetical protein